MDTIRGALQKEKIQYGQYLKQKVDSNNDLRQVEGRWMIKLVLRLAQEDGPLCRECIDHTQQGKHEPECFHRP